MTLTAPILLMSLLLIAPGPAQGPVSLLADVEAAAPDNPGAFYQPRTLTGVPWNGYLYFAADGDGMGSELWRSNGAAQNATLVRDLRPDGGSEPQLIGVLGGWLLFTADDGVAGRELWRCDGTAAGTQLLVDLTPGSAGSFAPDAPFARLNQWLYFLVGGRLWKTDGQPGNTFPVSSTVIGDALLVAGPSQLWLAVDNGGWQLWTSDGGSSVQWVTTLPAEPSGLTPLTGIQLLFACNDGSHGQELWRSDGTVAGTQMLVDLAPGAPGSGPTELTGWNHQAWFRAAEGGAIRLWRSDGTVSGTVPVDPAAGPRFPQHLTAAGPRLWFTATRSSGTNVGTEVWCTDGTAAGTQLVFDVWPGTPSSGAAGFAYDGAQWVYFSAHDGSTGYELWRSDGSTTQRVSDTVPGIGDGSPTVLGFAGVYCLFAAIHEGGVELFASQGNASALVRDIRRGSNGSSAPERITARSDGAFWFAAQRGPLAGAGALGREPHFSSGAPGSAQLLVDSVGGSGSGAGPNTRVAGFGPYTWFNTVPGSVLWRTAGTPASTNAIPGFQVTFTDMVAFAGRVYVEARTAATGEELFVFDNPTGAPILLKDILPGTGGGIAEPTVVANRLFFSAQDPQGTNLWSTDGTTNGTQRVWLNTFGGNFFNLRAAGRRLFFDLGSSPGPLLVSDGTAAGTRSVATVGQNDQRVVVGDRLFFAGEPAGAGTGLELCVTDGATLTLVKDILPGPGSSAPHAFTPFGNGVLFLADDGAHGTELWRSDGTAAGTVLVVDLLAGPASGATGFVYAPGNARRALFSGSDGSTGVELWRTDGTAAGTQLHADIQPGPLGSFPSRPTRCGTQLVFAATQTEPPAPQVGRELFALPCMAAAEAVGTPCAAGLATAPLADANGAPFLGNGAFALTLNAEPNAGALLLLGQPTELALTPCELRVTNLLTPLFVAVDGGGHAQLGLPVPASADLAGARLGAQWAVLQTGGPFLGALALSNGVDLILQAQ